MDFKCLRNKMSSASTTEPFSSLSCASFMQIDLHLLCLTSYWESLYQDVQCRTFEKLNAKDETWLCADFCWHLNSARNCFIFNSNVFSQIFFLLLLRPLCSLIYIQICFYQVDFCWHLHSVFKINSKNSVAFFYVYCLYHKTGKYNISILKFASLMLINLHIKLSLFKKTQNWATSPRSVFIFLPCKQTRPLEMRRKSNKPATSASVWVHHSELRRRVWRRNSWILPGAEHNSLVCALCCIAMSY